MKFLFNDSSVFSKFFTMLFLIAAITLQFVSNVFMDIHDPTIGMLAILVYNVWLCHKLASAGFIEV